MVKPLEVIKNFFLARRWEIGGFTLMLLCVFINLFPADHIILGADILQPIRMQERFISFHYDWFGQVSLFYFLFYLLDWAGVSATFQISFYLGFFLVGAYLSFLAFARLLFPDAKKSVAVLVSVFYATNLYTLYVFTATWGYTHYQIIYVFIPILTALFIASLREGGGKWSLWFFLAVALASMSFGNPAFALSLGLYFLLLTFFLFLFKILPFTSKLFRRLLFIGGVSFLLNAYWILPLLPQVMTGINQVNDSQFIDLSEGLSKSSNAIFDTVRLLQTSEQKNYYPENFPYQRLAFLKDTVAFLAFLPILGILFMLTRPKPWQHRKIFLVFFSLLLVFIALIARVRPPFDFLNDFFFQLPGFNVLRGYDKTATFAPFLLSALLLIALLNQERKKYFRILFSLFAVLIIVLALPFYAGGLQTKMSYILAGQKKKDFSEARSSALVKVPEDYFSVAETISQDKEENKIAMLPFSPGSSVGRTSLPAWKVNGPHVAYGLYDKSFVELNDFYIPGWMFGEDFENDSLDPAWITDLYGLLGVEYVFYHKDALPRRIEKMELARAYLENRQLLKKLSDTESFFLYTLEKSLVFPRVYAAKEVLLLKGAEDLPGLSQKIGEYRAGRTSLQYERLSLKEITIPVTAALAEKKILVLNEKMDPLWRAVYTDPQGQQSFLERENRVTYANAWKIGREQREGSIRIYHYSLPLLRIGLGLSLLSLGVVLFVLLRERRYNP